MNIFLYHPVAGLVRRIILAPTIVLFCYSGNASAQPAEVQELRLTVETLKKRVQELESVKTSKVKTRNVTGNPWHSLQVNMSKTEVRGLLGKPGRIDKWKTGEAWYFPTPKGGEIDFDANGKVSGWLEP